MEQHAEITGITEIIGIPGLTRITGAHTSNGGAYGKRNLNDP